MATGLLGKALYFVLFFSYVDLHLFEWKDVYKTVDFVMLDKDLTHLVDVLESSIGPTH